MLLCHFFFISQWQYLYEQEKKSQQKINLCRDFRLLKMKISRNGQGTCQTTSKVNALHVNNRRFSMFIVFTNYL